jgi:D-arabinose 1-dehydrogenase-like Zn-dependent alcohol dehydrogenase
MANTPAFAAASAGASLAPFTVERRDPRPQDVVIDILYCGVCHSDIHQARTKLGANAPQRCPVPLRHRHRQPETVSRCPHGR